MTSLRGALALYFAMWAGLAAAGEPLGSTEEGVVVLRSGQVLRGQIERVGDHFVVLVAAGAKVHLPAAEVDLHCRSVDEAFLRKRGYIEPQSVRQHLDLAEWCLRQGLNRRAAEQLSAAMQADPEEPRIAAVERLLREALEAPPPSRQTAGKSAAPVKLDDLEETMRSVPPGALERFTSAVQPVLLNRCSTSSCHGTASKSSFKLLRPAAGDTITRRYTQRNLHAVLQAIDRAAPEASPLLVAPRSAHGSAATAVFGQRDERQYEQLVQWVKQVAENEAPRTASLASTEPHLMQTADERKLRTHLKPSFPLASPASKSKPAEQAVPSEKPAAKPSSSPLIPKQPPGDPFDPELFNRRFFGEKK